MSREFSLFCTKLGIKHELTAPYSPQQNGVAERKNRTLIEKAKSMLSASKLPNVFWAEAVLTAAYISNLSPTYAVAYKNPHEAWFGTKPSVNHLRVFGCVAYTQIPAQKLQKLDKKAEKGVFVGYSQEAKAYRIYIPTSRKIVISRDV